MSATGYYAAQSDIENIYGKYNVALWSAKDGQATLDLNSDPVADSTQVQAALDAGDARVNYLASIYGYTTPLPTTIANWKMLKRLVAELDGIELYFARGIQDSGNDQAGKFAARRKQLCGWITEQGKKVPGELEDLFISKAFKDAPRASTVTACPTVVLSPAAVPYGGQNNFTLPGSQIPQLP